MTRCRKCSESTGRRYASLCDPCRGWRKVAWTTAMDEELRWVYAQGDYRNNGALGKLAARWKMPRWKVTHRAQRLGIAAVKEPPWSVEEVRILERNCHLSPRIISSKLRARGYRRTQTGIVLKRKRLRLKRSDRGYSAGALAGVMGVHRNQVLTWIRRGLLPAQRLGSQRPPQQVASDGEWFIRPRRVRQFIIEHVALVDVRKCDKYWLVDLLADKNGGL